MSSQQKPVDPQELRKRRAAKRKQKKWSREEEQELFFKRAFSCRKDSVKKLYSILDTYCFGMGDRNYYKRVVPKAAKDLWVLLPFYDDVIYGLDEEHTLVIMKGTNKRRHYLDRNQWEEVFKFLKRSGFLGTVIRNIYFCVATRDQGKVKIRDKEYDVIREYGFTEHFERTVLLESGPFKMKRELVGKLFSIL